MTTWALLAPGPSASAEQAEQVREAGIPLGVVGCAYQLAPWADFIAASDSSWWRKYLEAMQLPKRYAMHVVKNVDAVRVQALGSICNSGVLAMECAKRQGATRLLLLGFDMHGTHFFGPYTNGLSNTSESKRRAHLAQYDRWRRANPGVEVVNCTDGSALKCFKSARLKDELEQEAKARCRKEQGADERGHCELRGLPRKADQGCVL